MRGAWSSVFRDQQTPPLSAITLFHCRNTAQQSSMLKPDIGRSQKSRFLPHLWGPHRNSAITFGMKNRMVWLSDGGKNWICLLVSTEYTNMTDRRTPHDGISRAYAYAAGGRGPSCSALRLIACIIYEVQKLKRVHVSQTQRSSWRRLLRSSCNFAEARLVTVDTAAFYRTIIAAAIIRQLMMLIRLINNSTHSASHACWRLLACRHCTACFQIWTKLPSFHHALWMSNIPGGGAN